MFVNNSINDGQILIGFFLGAALINAIYSIFMFIKFKEKGNPVLFIFIASLGLAIWIFSEYIFKYFNLNNNWWSDVSLPIFIFASLAASIQLCLLIFNPGKTNLLLKKILIYERNVFIVFLILPMFIQSAIYIKLSAFGAILTIVSICICCNYELDSLERKKTFFIIIGFGLFFIRHDAIYFDLLLIFYQVTFFQIGVYKLVFSFC